MLNSNEHEVKSADKCYNANNGWHFTFISRMDTVSDSSKNKNSHLFSALKVSFCYKLKINAQLS